MKNNKLILSTLEELLDEYSDKPVVEDFALYLKLSNIVYNVKDKPFEDKLLYVKKSLKALYEVKPNAIEKRKE